MKKWMIWAATSVLITAVGIFIFLLLPGNETDTHTAAEAEAAVTGLYGGNIENLTDAGDAFLVEFTRPEGRYKATVNKSTGQIETMELIEKSQQDQMISEEDAIKIATEQIEGTVEGVVYSQQNNEYEIKIAGAEETSTVYISAQTGDIQRISAEPVAPDEDTERVISPEEATAIAKETLQGEVQEIEFTESDDGGYYLVEIENDETDQEVTVQVHAIRGEAMAVEWED